MILHGDELGPPIFLRAELHHGELIRPHTRRADVVDLARNDEVMQSLHSLFYRRVWIETMDPEEIDVRRA